MLDLGWRLHINRSRLYYRNGTENPEVNVRNLDPKRSGVRNSQ